MTHNPKIATWCGTAAVFALALVSRPLPAEAADGNPPALMTYQSYLTDANGVALGNTAPKNYDVIFRIYNDQSASGAGNLLWSEEQTVTVDKGYFSVLLGEGSAFGSETRPPLDAVFTGSDLSSRFVEMTVKKLGTGNTDAIIKPRLRLLSAPYAFSARNAISAGNLVNSTNVSVVNVTGSYVGINKLNPAAALDVSGTAAISGALSAGSAAVSGTLAAGSATVSGSLSAVALTVTNATVNGTVKADSFIGNGTIPVGGIIMWSGSTTNIPTGWALCDGTQTASNGQTTPNLQNRFIVGAGATYPAGASGGANTVRLAADQLPSHTHTYKDTYILEDSASFSNPIGANGDSETSGFDNIHGNGDLDWNNNTFFYRKLITDAFGAGNAVDIRPQYYALAYIMRMK
jgi:hypothetical protein